MSVIDDIKQKIDIVEVISGYTKLQKSGRNYKALCPFHSEKTPSFFIFPEQQTWHCFGACGVGGDIYAFIMKKEGMDFAQTLRFFADKLGITIDQPAERSGEEVRQKELVMEINEIAANYYHELLLHDEASAIARRYLNSRGISEKIIDKFLLGYCRDKFEDLCIYLFQKGYKNTDLIISGLVLKHEDGSLYDRFRNRLMFPIWDYQARVIGFGARSLDDTLPKYINSPQTIVFDKSHCLYAIDKAKQSIRQKNNAIITEGYMDVLTSHQYGWENTVATMGTALTDNHLRIIKKLTRNIFLALDADMAGEEATRRIAESISAENFLNVDVKVVKIVGVKDPDEAIKQNPAIWEQGLENAKPLIDFILDFIRRNYNLNNPNNKLIATEKFLPIILKFDDPVRRGTYIRRFSEIIGVRENYLIDIINKIKIDSERNRYKNRVTEHKADVYSTFFANTQIEENCLSIILKFPEIKELANKIPLSDFERSENLEIYSKWIKYKDIEKLKLNIDPTLLTHLEKLLDKKYPQIEQQTEEKRGKTFQEYINRFHCDRLKMIQRRKAELLAIEAQVSGHDVARLKLEEQGTPEAEKLRELYGKPKRRQIA